MTIRIPTPAKDLFSRGCSKCHTIRNTDERFDMESEVTQEPITVLAQEIGAQRSSSGATLTKNAALLGSGEFPSHHFLHLAVTVVEL
jgi:hypothetical protein